MADVDRLAAALLTLLQASDATVSSYLHIQHFAFLSAFLLYTNLTVLCYL